MATSFEQSNRQMRMVLDITRLLAVTTDLDELLRRIADAATALLECERASIFIHDPASNQLWTKVALGSVPIRVPSDKGIVGAAFTSNRVLHIPDPYSDPRFNPEPDRRTGFRTRNLLTAPMSDLEGKPIGVIQALNKKAGGFADDDLALAQMLADQAGVAVQRHNLQLAAIEITALRKEMDLAKRVQQALIPKHPPVLPGLTAVGWTLAASVTGGDCFDLWQASDGSLGVFLGDASGHGLAPALVVSQVRTLIRAMSDTSLEPHGLLVRVNHRLSQDLEWGRFVTAFLAFIGPEGQINWASAGHGPTLLRRSPGAAWELLDPPVQPLGVLDEWFDGGPTPVTFEPGGILIVMSDGIVEAPSPDGELYGDDRVIRLLDEHADSTPETIIAALRSAVHDWAKRDEPVDDQTVVVVRRFKD